MEFSYFYILYIVVFFRFLFMLNNLLWIKLGLKSNNKIIAFFHPYCNGGGGGERVLWMYIYSLLSNEKTTNKLHIAIYSGEKGVIASEILQNVEKKFHIKLPDSAKDIIFINIRSRTLLEAKWYPVFTMLFQSLASMLVGLECIIRLTPDFYFDTTGAAFSYLIIKLFTTAKIITYVHYPTISKDMLQKVREQRPTYNNNERITTSTTASTIKIFYYYILSLVYTLCGYFTDLVMVNSTWTKQHILQQWGGNPTVIYPPCNTTELQKISITTKRKKIILSVGQFRPEKDHKLQIKSLQLLLEKDPKKYKDVQLVLLGGTRNTEDQLLVDTLKDYANSLGIHSKNIKFEINATFSELKSYYETALIGIHSMWNEHFGISIVEMMAAGLIVIAHNSGGPKLDIINDNESERTGYLAESPEEYASRLSSILDEDEAKLQIIRERARLSTQHFSDESFLEQVKTLFLVK